MFPGNLSRKKFLNALERLGFEVSLKGGDGSHCKATWPKNGKMVIIQKDLRKDVLVYVCKEIEKISGISWDDIQSNL